MMSSLYPLHDPMHNVILAALPAEDFARLQPELELVAMPRGWIVCDTGEKLSYVYFPINAIVSLLYVIENGASVEIAVTGRNGLVGIPLCMGGDTTTTRAVVQSAGMGYRLKASIMKREFHNGGKLQQLVLSYTQALITQTAQIAVCNRHHSVVQQLCRWLLLNVDLLSSNELLVTQELIANMLGVRREGITEAAGKLQAEGLIRYSRGHIQILDRAGLEKRACECYCVVKNEWDRLLPTRSQHAQASIVRPMPPLNSFAKPPDRRSNHLNLNGVEQR